MKYDLEKIEERIKKEKKIKKIIKITAMIIVIFLFSINLLLAYYDYVEKNNKIIDNKIYLFTIVSESMKPTIDVNDLIIVEKKSIDKIKKNDIITYRKDNKIISHRAIEIEQINGNTYITTKGDNNNIEDGKKVKDDEIYGKVIGVIPNIGACTRFIQKENGIFITLLILILIFLMINKKTDKKIDRKNKRKKYELKKKREEYKN